MQDHLIHQTSLQRIFALLDRLSPEPRTSSQEVRRRVRATTAAALVGAGILAATAASSLALGDARRFIPLNVACALALLLLLPLARRLDSPALLANGLVTLAFSHTLLISTLAGGQNVGALFAFSVFPMLAMLLAGWRSSLAFTGLSVAAVILTPMTPVGWLGPADLPAAPVDASLVRDALNVIVAVGLVAALYDAARSASLRDAEASRTRAESMVGRQQQLVDLSRRLQEASGSRFDAVLRQAVEQTARLAGADRTMLQTLPGAGFSGRFAWGDGAGVSEPTHPALADAATARNTFPWTTRRVSKGLITQVPRVAALPSEAAAELAHLERRGVVSWLCVPIRAEGRTIAYQSFETTGREKVWSDEEVSALQLMAELLASAVVRHRSEERLRESEERFALAFRDHPDAMIIMDLETDEILECNEKWLREADRETREEVLGRRPWDFEFEVSVEQRDAIRHRLRTEGRLPAVEIPVNGRGGVQRTYLISAVRIDLGGRPCALANIHDLTTRKQLEAQLLHAQKMEAVGRLAGGVAHDYNNMLTVISGYSASLIANLEGDLRKDAEEIHEAARRSAAITRQLLAFSRRQMLQTEVLDPNRLLASLESMLRPLIGESIDLHLELEDRVGHVRSDRGQLEQAVVNLVVNARDAMRSGGTVRVETRRVAFSRQSPPEVRPGDIGPGTYVVISVADEGEGMNPELVEHVMEPFYTTKPEGQGTGLGLPMVHGIARQCGGTLCLESEPGRGTRASIYLPAVEASQVEGVAAGTASGSAGASARRRILLVHRR
jgi:PAS domain S-box-containing protein